MFRPDSLPTVRVALTSAVWAAGVEAVLAAAGLPLAADEEDADVLIVDDAWLPDLPALAGQALVALGSREWAAVLPGVLTGGWAALTPDATPAELVAGVLGAAAGLVTLLPAALTAEPEADPVPAGEVTLTPREHDVLALLAEGLSNKRAARDLGVSESTVKFHVQALYSKLGVQSRAGAVARGIALGLVSV
ncbi:response regulator transcription factor [Deinococcus sp. HMF7604]|uniref:response regulator transcription factor n=1 Tax=Deinococcus betulae TaxID=2873312 RepID=UPI001CCBB395|nr:response regulator transcription factor [Deinococcus betulae]MBZ9752314.1 response regulator transcription factor [Deinococcus betulae]